MNFLEAFTECIWIEFHPFEGAGAVWRMQAGGKAPKRKGRDCGSARFITCTANCREGWKCQTAPEAQAAAIRQNYLYTSIVFIYRFGRQLGRCMSNWTSKLRLSGSCLQGNDAPKHRFGALRCLSQIYARNWISDSSRGDSSYWHQQLFINRISASTVRPLRVILLIRLWINRLVRHSITANDNFWRRQVNNFRSRRLLMGLRGPLFLARKSAPASPSHRFSSKNVKTWKSWQRTFSPFRPF